VVRLRALDFALCLRIPLRQSDPRMTALNPFAGIGYMTYRPRRIAVLIKATSRIIKATSRIKRPPSGGLLVWIGRHVALAIERQEI
jgi:hypothetical protein